MKNFSKKTFRQTIISSALIIIMSLMSMIGGTFAWFTDQVTSDTNRIVSGNLDIEMYYQNNATLGIEGGWANVKGMGEDPLFFVDKEGKDILWEPGVVSVCHFDIKNVGNLALKYQLSTKITDGNDAGSTKKLSDVIKASIMAYTTLADRDAAIAAGDTAGWGSLAAVAADAELSALANKQYTVVLYWEPTEHDNDYNMNNANQGKKMWIDIDFHLVAAQYNEENDVYDKDYDKHAQYDVSDQVIALPTGTATSNINLAELVPAGYHCEDVTITGVEGTTVSKLTLLPATGNREPVRIDHVSVENIDFSNTQDVVMLDLTQNADDIIGTIEVKNCNFTGSGVKTTSNLTVRAAKGSTATVEFTNCTFTDCGYVCYWSGAADMEKIVYKGCKFVNTKSWVCLINNAFTCKEVVFEDCEFVGCNGGLVKFLYTSTIDTFVFKNNKITSTMSATSSKWFEVNIICKTIDISGNQLRATELDAYTNFVFGEQYTEAVPGAGATNKGFRYKIAS